MSLISAGSISLDSTFKATICLVHFTISLFSVSLTSGHYLKRIVAVYLPAPSLLLLFVRSDDMGGSPQRVIRICIVGSAVN